jgi:putative aldouronate transport system permease protein
MALVTAKNTKLTEPGRVKKALRYVNKKKYLYILLIPGVVYFLIFNYIPMYGVVIAFKDFNFAKGILSSPWIGFENFKYMFGLSDFYTVFWNSLYLSFLRLVFGFPFPIILALLLNEMRSRSYQKITQTLIYLPHFISWVVIGGILVNFLKAKTINGSLILASLDG